MSRTAAPHTRDPRTIVTPEAFEVSADLLGRPLARPSRRLVAILVDLALVGLVSQAGGLVLGVVAILFFIRLGTGRERSAALTWSFRAAVGCFGAVVLLATSCGLWYAFGPGSDRSLGERIADRLGQDRAVTSIPLAELVGGVAEVRAVRTAANEEEAVTAAASVARRMERIGAPRDEISDALKEIVPADAPWRDRMDEIVGQALARAEVPASPDQAGAPDTTQSAGAPAATSPEAGAGLDSADTVGDAASSATVPGPAADTIAALRSRLADETAGRDAAERRLLEMRGELETAREGWFLRTLRGLADQLGLAFGWGTIYMTVFLAWWSGRTPGKRLLGLRVVRLDGSPISWWAGFERAGGYAAGFATGLLGFAQVLWDPNRQAIHDKIAQTVVVRDGAEPLPGPWRTGPGASTTKRAAHGSSSADSKEGTGR